MAGNSVEEALFQQPDNPTHTDIARISVPAGAAIAIFVYFLLRVFAPGLGAIVPGALGLVVGPWLGLLLHRRLDRQILERDATQRQAARDEAEAETERELSEMRSRSAAAAATQEDRT